MWRSVCLGLAALLLAATAAEARRPDPYAMPKSSSMKMPSMSTSGFDFSGKAAKHKKDPLAATGVPTTPSLKKSALTAPDPTQSHHHRHGGGHHGR